MTSSHLAVFASVLIVALSATLSAAGEAFQVGVAQIDITPAYPIRLSGFGFRRDESEGVTQPIWAKALAFDDDAQALAVLVTVDNLAIPAYMTQEVAARLAEKARVEPARFTITCSHTHTAPMLRDVCPTLFGVPIPPEHLEHIDRYTRELTDKLEQVALLALRDLKPARVEVGIGRVGFAINRRPQGGPVDHDLPVLAVRDPNGNLRAIYTSYACHCVTLSDNKISGDWAGYAQEAIQKRHPGVIALTSVGCGADSNPDAAVTGDKAEIAARQGFQIAEEVDRLLTHGLTRVSQKLTTQSGSIDLPFDKHPSRDEWLEKAKRTDAVGHHARVQLAKLDRGEPLQTALHYPIQTWTFGDQLALVFLPGEVVVDYSLRLKREFDRRRLWVNGYSNDEPCYIPSERILKEGGYEGGDAMVYYDRPARFAPGLEQKIINELHRQLPPSFLAPKGTEGTVPRAALDSLRAIRTKPGLELRLVASEPLVQSPVAIDWSVDGKLWVCEMYDYPTGLDGNWKPGGRVKCLEDIDGDGHYDRATLFLDNLPFPTGITSWRDGLLICAAPDILYAEDTDHDGKADVVKKLFTGFYTDNYQARVNSLSLGLDNWIYGANGLLGGVIRGEINGKEMNIRGQDFRMKPDTGEFEPVSGLTQQGRVRDDWGAWFGCDNSTSLRHYPLPDHYLRRNPYVASLDPGVYVPEYQDSNRVFSTSRAPERYNDPDNFNRMTSACGLGLYRDDLLGAEYYGNAFVCEPVHNLVHREVVVPKGVTFTSHRPPDEMNSEFLTSTDTWFRPVQVRTGPDGALWVVDMYRFLIEHPRWIQPERLAQIDARAGADMGRIYCVLPKDGKLRSVRNLTRLDATSLVAALNSPNGTERDRVHAELLRRKDNSTHIPLVNLAAKCERPEVRVQAMCALGELNPRSIQHLTRALDDVHPLVRQHAIRLSEPALAGSFAQTSGSTINESDVARELIASVFSKANDSDPRVRFQLALSLGCSRDQLAGHVLGKLATNCLADPHQRAAVLSSAEWHCGEIFEAVLATPVDAPDRSEMLSQLIATATAGGHRRGFNRMLLALAPTEDGPMPGWRLIALASLLNGANEDLLSLHAYLADKPDLLKTEASLRTFLLNVGRIVRNQSGTEPEREAAIKLLGRVPETLSEDIQLLSELFISDPLPRLHAAALATLRGLRGPQVASTLLAGWNHHSPSLRAEILSLLLSRDSWIVPLFSALKEGVIQPSEISLADRRRLIQSPGIAQEASVFFAAGSSQDRSELLKDYQSALSIAGVPSRGSEAFSKNCASCHRFRGQGHEVGPDLAPLHDKEPEYWLKNILDPNAVVEPRFVNYHLETKDGRVLSGIIKAETSNSLMLVQAGGLQETILRSNIAEIRASGVSLMPEGLTMTPQEFADLITFLKQPPPPKSKGN